MAKIRFATLFALGFFTYFLWVANLNSGSVVAVGRPGLQTSFECDRFDSFVEFCRVQGEACTGTYTEYFLAGPGGRQRTINVQIRCDNDGSGPCDPFPKIMAVDNALCCDRDLDSFASPLCGGGDCNDDPARGGASINPGALELCSDGIDNDCDGMTDLADPQCSCPTRCLLPPLESGCYFDRDPCRYPHDGGCPQGTFPYGDCCCYSCPILIDINGNGFALTDAAGGVDFDHNNDGARERISWTSANSDDAWLALDRNGNGTIDGGRELFGNTTPQPSTPEPNGFIALAEYDKPARGGNNDGRISQSDTIFSSLRLWQDANHNGISEPRELHGLLALGLASTDLDYRESRRVDEHGNRFKYRAKVTDVRGAQLGRWAWDVFLLRRQ